jgi:hypothetical protein
VVDVEIEYCGVDSFITGAAWDDTGIAMTDEELTDLQDEHGDWVHERATEHYGYGPK